MSRSSFRKERKALVCNALFLFGCVVVALSVGMQAQRWSISFSTRGGGFGFKAAPPGYVYASVWNSFICKGADCG